HAAVRRLVDDVPRAVRFTFGPTGDTRAVELRRYELFGLRGKRLLLRARLSSGHFSLPGFSQRRGRPRSGADEVTDAIRFDLPDHFLFTMRAVGPELLNQALRRIQEAENRARRGRAGRVRLEDVSVELPELAVFYTKFVSE